MARNGDYRSPSERRIVRATISPHFTRGRMAGAYLHIHQGPAVLPLEHIDIASSIRNTFVGIARKERDGSRYVVASLGTPDDVRDILTLTDRLPGYVTPEENDAKTHLFWMGACATSQKSIRNFSVRMYVPKAIVLSWPEGGAVDPLHSQRSLLWTFHPEMWYIVEIPWRDSSGDIVQAPYHPDHDDDS